MIRKTRSLALSFGVLILAACGESSSPSQMSSSSLQSSANQLSSGATSSALQISSVAGTSSLGAVSSIGGSSSGSSMGPSSSMGSLSSGVSLSSTGSSSSMAVGGTVTYTTDIAPIMTQHCTSCHGSRGDVNLETYANVKLNADRSLTEMKLGTMPKYSSMPADQIAKFQAWIDGGLLQ